MSQIILKNIYPAFRILNSNSISCRNTFSTMSSRDKRYFSNPYPDFGCGEDSQFIDVANKKIQPGFLKKIENLIKQLLGSLEKNLSSCKQDESVYTGSAGTAYLYLLLSEKNENSAYLEKSEKFIEQSLSRLRNRDISFICGDGGPLALGAVIYKKLNKGSKSKECAATLLSMASRVVAQKSRLPDELLYGRVGYLFCLLFLNKYMPGTVSDDIIKQVITAVIMSGVSLAGIERLPSPLMYKWYEEFYLGGAHGIAGILYLLLQVLGVIFISGEKLAKEDHLNCPLMFEWHDKKYLGGAHGVAGILYLILQAKDYVTDEQLQLIRPTIDFLLDIRHTSGNFPSSIGSSSDRLVHWCHGAPGTVQLLCTAYQVFGDQRYLQAAEACGDVVWERGLLRKGYGICHGVAGNCYTFLSLFQLTQDVKHLYRACRFAEWCLSYNENQDRIPDRPFSLYEGLAGTVYFLVDFQDSINAKFPGFTI